MSKEDNLTPFTSDNAAEMGAKGGHAKAGSKHLKTLIQEIGNDIDWDKTTLRDKEKMKQLYGKNGWTALIYVAFTKALSGDSKAMDWLAKNGYGTNVDITTLGDKIAPVIIYRPEKLNDDISEK
jgi:hypothetical protein